MKTKGRLFWTRLLTMMALCIAALIAGLSFGMTSAYAENADKAASSEDGGVSVLALPENVTVTGITGVELTGTVTTESSYAEIKAALAVTATGSDGETYKLDPDEFEVVGVFEDGAIETNTFRIVCGTVTSEATFGMSGEPVRNDAVRSITAEYVNDGSTMLYSYSSLEFDVKDMVQVTRWTWAGEGTIAGSEEFVLEGQLTPSRAGQTQPYSKEITVRRFIGDETSNISCTLEIPDIQPAAPSAIRITTAPGTVVAFSKIDPAAWVLQVEYEDDPWGNTFEIPLSMVTVQYADASGETTDEEGNPYKGFVYDGGRSQVIFSYSENGETVTVRRQIAVSRVSISQVYFLGVGEYKYSVTENNEVEGTDQTASIVNYNSDIMKIASVSLSGSQASVPFDTQAGTITVCDAGTYTVRVELTNAAYYFENRQAPDDTYMEIEYTVDPVEPPIEIEWSENAYDGEDLKWDRDDIVSFELLKNYGNGEVTYTYRRTDGSTTAGTAEDPNLPNETGTYTLTVKVEANGNFAAFEGELAKFTVGQRVIGLPTLNNPEVNDGNLVYNGAKQEASITYAGGEGDADYLDVVDTGGENVGTCTVTFTIKDQYADEAEWDSSIVNGDGVTIDGNTLTLTYQITRLSIAIPTFGANGTITTPYDGSPNNGTAQTQQLGNWAPSAGFAEGVTSPVTVSIQGGSGAVSADSKNGTVTATNAGTYTIKVSLGDTDNLQWAGGTSVDDLGFSWTIDKATVTIPDAGSKTYTGGALTSDLADTDFYTVSQETDWVNAGDYDVTLTLTDVTNYKWSDGREDGSITVTFTIDPRAVTIDWDEKTFSFIYDGNSHVASASVGNIRSQNGVPDDVSFVISGEQTNANTDGASYTATIESLTGDQARNYTLEGVTDDRTQTFTIAPRLIGIVWGTTTHVYDGDSWHPEAASFTNVIEGDSVGTLTYEGAKTDADTNYTVTVTAVSNSNYTVSGGTNISTTFTITPYEVDKPGEMANDDFTYTAAPQTYLPDGFNPTPFGEDTMTISGNVQTNAGTYTVTVSLASGNYKWSDTDDRSAVVFTDKFVIAKAELTVTWTGTVTTYDGIAFTPSYSLSGWKEQDNASDYTWSWTITGEKVTDNSAVDAGSYHAVLLISAGESGFLNYYLSGNETDFVINKAQVDVSEIVSEPEGIAGNLDLYDRGIPFTDNNGSHLVIEPSSLYGIESRTSGDDVGDYEVVLRLTHPENFEWYSTNDLDSIDPDDASLITIGYRITYSQFELKIEIAETWVYGNNDGKKPIVTSENPTGNEVVFTYYKQNESGEYVSVGNTLPKDVGSYRVSASVENGNNYSGVFNEEVYFTITPRTVTVEISVSDDTYGSWSGASIAEISGYADSGYEQIGNSDISLIYESLTSGVELVNRIPQNAGSYSVTAQFATGANPNGNYTLAVAYTTDGAFTISPLVLTVTGWDGDTKVYAGQGSSYQPAVSDANVQEKFGDTLEGLGLEYTVTANEGSALSADGLAVDVGSYTVKVTGIGNKNYTLDGATGIEQSFTITPYTIAFTITPQDTVYGSFKGDDVDIRIDYTTNTIGGESAKLSFSYTGTLNSGSKYTDKFEAGSYTVTATIGNKNYQLADGVKTQKQGFTIDRYEIGSTSWWRSYDLTYRNANLYAEYDEAFATARGVYDDGTLSLSEKITQDGVAATFRNAGEYLFTAELTPEQAYNYVLSTTFAQTYTITPAEISIQIDEKSATYRGTGYDASEVFTGGLGSSYTVSGSTFNVDLDEAVRFAITENLNAGSYAVTMTFTDPNFTVSGWSGEAGDQSFTFENAFTIDPALLTPSFTTDGGAYGDIDATVAAGNGWSVEGLVNSE